MFEHLSKDKKRVNVRDFGAKGDGVANDTAAIIAAEDSLKNGGIVYFPAGVYMIDFVPFRQGVTLLLEGKVDDVSKGFTDDVQKRIDNGEFAIIRTTCAGDMFINHEKYEYARHHAVSDFGLSGGVVDSMGSVRAFIFCLANNVLLENCIVLDSRNDHAVQVTGSTNVLIRNCMFAGYKFSGNIYAETIQIEHASHYAIGPQGFATSNFSFGDITGSENVVVENCYFGKSAKYGPPLIPIGHHCPNVVPAGLHCAIRNCVFDNPLMMALRLLDYCDFEVSGCTFIGTAPRDLKESDRMIDLYLKKFSHQTVTQDEEGNYIVGTISPDFHCPGNMGIRIKNNRFVISEDRFPHLINAVGSEHLPGLAPTYFTEIDYCGGPFRLFRGYKTVNNYVSDLDFSDNEIEIVDEKPINLEYLMYFERIIGLRVKNNKIKKNGETFASWYAGEEGVFVKDCRVGDETKTLTLKGEWAWGKRIVLPLSDGQTAKLHCRKPLTIVLKCPKGGKLVPETDEDGNGIVKVKCGRGYRFIGWEGNAPQAGEQEYEDNLTLCALFERK